MDKIILKMLNFIILCALAENKLINVISMNIDLEESLIW